MYYTSSSSRYRSEILYWTVILTTVKFKLITFCLTVKAATLIFISWRGSAISSAYEGKLGFIYNLVKS